MLRWFWNAGIEAAKSKTDEADERRFRWIQEMEAAEG